MDFVRNTPKAQSVLFGGARRQEFPEFVTEPDEKLFSRPLGAGLGATQE
jgi:hypothetical protein